MCLNDFRRKTFLKTTVRRVAVPAAGAQLCGTSNSRVAVEFASPVATAIPVAADTLPAAGVGAAVGVAVPPVRYSSLDFGDMPTRAFFAGPTAAGGTIQVTEVLVSDADLAAERT